MQDNNTVIDALLVKPGEFPRQVQISTELKALQQAVGGYIEFTYPFDDDVGIICNEEGKLSGLPLNRAMRDEDGRMYDIIAGDFLVVGLRSGGFDSLSPKLMEKYERLFHAPEAFVQMGRGIMVLPIDDETVRSNMEDRQSSDEQQDAHKKPSRKQESSL